MYRRFGTALDEFAAAIDIVDEQVLDDVLGLVTKYLIDELGFNFYEILLERWVRADDGPERVLDTLRESERRTLSHVPLEDESTSQTSYCFVKDCPLWITAEDQGLLKRNTAKYIDSWSSTPPRELPLYQSGNRFYIKTSIAQPLRNGQGTFGVINVESEEHLPCNRWAKRELGLLAKGVASIVGRYLWSEVSRRETRQSTERLKELLSTDRWNVMGKPKLFIACSERAADNVVKVILEAAAQPNDYQIVFWQKRDEGGDVRQRMLRDLRESRVIICYLSEPADEGRYVDNANVLFEAGIADGLACGWSDVELIPVRERCCVKQIPFDIGGLEVLLVPRSIEGVLDENEFNSRLLQRLKLY
jgi:hypothetical protein